MKTPEAQREFDVTASFDDSKRESARAAKAAAAGACEDAMTALMEAAAEASAGAGRAGRRPNAFTEQERATRKKFGGAKAAFRKFCKVVPRRSID